MDGAEFRLAKATIDRFMRFAWASLAVGILAYAGMLGAAVWLVMRYGDAFVAFLGRF